MKLSVQKIINKWGWTLKVTVDSLSGELMIGLDSEISLARSANIIWYNLGKLTRLVMIIMS